MKTIKIFLYISIFGVIVFAAQLLLDDVLKMYQNNELKNSHEALKLLEDEAKNNNTNAAFLLATAYRNGKAGVIDINRAIYWYKISAKSGDSDAMLMLGWLYYKEPKNLNINLKKARYWFKKAASNGVDEAIEMLELLRSRY